jgi:hypothetical protein
VYPTQEAILSLCQKLHLPYPDAFEQDWQHTVVEPKRIHDFLWLYEHDADLTDNEKLILGMLIIGSLNEALDRGEKIESSWQTTLSVLQNDFPLHRDTLRYWACLDEPDSTNWFPITHRVRTIVLS